jgi:general nucleoside transport system permease protein
MWEIVANEMFIIDFGHAVIRMAIPLILAGLACTLTERAGIFNLGAEGMMLAGALAGAAGALHSSIPVVGFCMAAITGGFIGAMLAFFSVNLGANQIITGIMINIFTLGITTHLARIVIGASAKAKLPDISDVSIPILSKIPVMGPILFVQSPIFYFSILLTIGLSILLFKTEIGLAIRSVGENPQAADSAGINVAKIQYICVICSGMLAAIAGAFLSIGMVSYFTENMSAGRGYIALTIVILGRWRPVGVAVAALLFGGIDALQLRLQTFDTGIPYHFWLMLPYICGLVAISGFIGRVKAPEAVGKPYVKQT